MAVCSIGLRMTSADAIGAIADMCRARNVPIIAEHIEDEEALELVRQVGITMAKGSSMGAPSPIRRISSSIPGF